MRWRYPDVSESAQRARMEARMDGWWQAFMEKEAQLRALFAQRSSWDLPGFMAAELESLGEHLFWEFGPGVTDPDGHRLVITCESHHAQRPFIERLLARAPRLPGWDFLPYRPRETTGIVESTVAQRCGIDVTSWRAHIKPGPHGLVELSFSVPDLDERAGYAAVVAAEGLLGEERLDEWVGGIEVHQDEEGAPLDELRAAVDAHVASRRESLPELPWAHPRHAAAQWTLLRLRPEPADDYPAQEDLELAHSVSVDFFKNSRSGARFTSGRHSRHGETFAYVKLDGREGFSPHGFIDRQQLEDALDDALVPSGLGRNIGGGTGLRYGYVDVALTDVDRALEKMVAVLRSGAVPRRSWVLFFDDTLASEWVGVWPDSPPPPE